MHHREKFDPTAQWNWKAALSNGSRRTPNDWRPQPGDCVAGVVVDRGELPSRYSGHGPIEFLDIKVLGGSLNGEALEPDSWSRVLCGHARLREMLIKDDPRIGDRVAIEYLGKRQFRNGLSRMTYRTVCEKAAPAPGAEAATADSPW